MNLDFLTRAELRNLTGTPVRNLQLEWLRARRWPHEVNRVGDPVVLRSAALERLGAPSESKVWTLSDRNIA